MTSRYIYDIYDFVPMVSFLSQMEAARERSFLCPLCRRSNVPPNTTYTPTHE